MKRRFLFLTSWTFLGMLVLTGCTQATPATMSSSAEESGFAASSSGQSASVSAQTESEISAESVLTSSSMGSESLSGSTGSILSETAHSAGSAESETAPPSPTVVPAIVYSENNVEFVGRFFTTPSGTTQFDWSGSSITAGFTGTQIAVRLKVAVDNPTNGSCDYFNISIDNNKSTVLKITKEKEYYLLASSLKSGHHTVKLVKRTEGVFGTLVEFGGFDYLAGKAAPAPARKPRRIEIYGDSISAGYGNEGTEPGFRLAEENASLTYGMIAADLLGAECTDIALSGHGVHISLGGAGAKVLPDYYDKLMYHSSITYRFPSEMDPDAVIINLGSNDYAMNVDNADFYQSYLSFAETLHGKYPRAYIVCMIGGGQDRYLDILNQVAKALKLKYPSTKIGVFFSEFSIFSADSADIGSDGHPSVSGHRKLGAELAVYLQEKLGWK